MRLQDVWAPCASRVDSTKVLSIELGVEETAPPGQSSSGLPEWKWRISALNTDKIKRRSIGYEPQFRQVIIASKTNAAQPQTERRLEDLLRALGLWNTDLVDDSGQKQPSGAILINNLSTVLNRILTHPLIVKARRDWDLGERAEELKLPVELHSLIGLFGQIWIPERESRNIFGSLYQDPFVGPELKKLFFAPRPYVVDVGFYVGNPVPNHQPVRFRTPTEDEEKYWTDKVVKNPVFAFNLHILRENGGRSLPGAGFRPGLFQTVFEMDPDFEGPDGRLINLFAPLVNPLKPPPPRPALHYWTSPTRPPVKMPGTSESREAPSRVPKEKRYPFRSNRSRVVSRELRSRMAHFRLDDDEE
ncbi:hypothetical protein QBC37DRAFT_400600 [Rhypophila decipiens]|uniref:Uncharacterized protein n=1 Tax=Rhypophila decipiens TaxID=261697 RepID=A0AAN7B775_9PEZI|nr:hypothetical protein QBC37DRAFT_400600 [Rhypophila decipiens]